MALRTTCQTVGRERAAFPLERGRCRNDKLFDWYLIGVIVAAREIVAGGTGPLDRRGGNPRRSSCA